jgi:UDP-N-acetylmuramoyl-tripeptide--D-alanyl-D-alanine ligase
VKISSILEATGGILIGSVERDSVRSFSTDTRTLKRGDFFIAIKGKRFDGHSFLGEAIRKGASGLIVSKSISGLRGRIPIIIKVKDTLRALGDIARYKRMHSGAFVIAVTGSNGKTTTKEMIAAILKKTHFKALCTKANENNHIGLPLTLLKLKNEDVVVLEMGMNHPGEIDYLSGIARPNVGIITNIGPCHLEYLGSTQDVLKAKLEILKHMTPNSTLIVNNDDEHLSTIKGITVRLATFSVKRKGDYKAESLKPKGRGWNFSLNKKHDIRLNLLGRHNAYNALAAIAAVRILGVGYKRISLALKDFRPPKSRLETRKIKGISIIDDTYNSNPVSLRCAIDALRQETGYGRKILVSGDMLELGRMSRFFHEEIADIVGDSDIDMLITVGRHSHNTYLAAKKKGIKIALLRHYDTPKGAATFLKNIAKRGDLVLIKGSRAIKMEEAFRCFTTSFTR